MSQYVAPISDLRFLLGSVIETGGILNGVLDLSDIDAILEEAGKFASEVLAPLNSVGDKHGARLTGPVVDMPPGFAEAWTGFAEGGWNSVTGNSDHGGQGFPTLIGTALNEIWNGANMAFALCPLLTQGAVECLERVGSPELQQKYLPNLISGRWTGTMNLTESQAGSDLAALRTKAVPEGDGYRITGQKIFITFGDHEMTENIIHLVLARLPDAPPGIKGISLFLVPKFRVNADGTLGARNDVRCVSLEHKLGIHASPTAVLSFGDEGGAFGELIGEANRGLEYMFIMMNNARLNVGVQGIGIAERAYQQARDYARTRIQGRPVGIRSDTPLPIIQHPDIRRMLLTSKVRIEAARALALEAAASLDRGRGANADPAQLAKGELLIPICKAWSTDLGVSVASLGLQIHGGMGYIEETGAAQHYRDARIAPIYEGTNGIQANDLLGRKLLRDQGAAMKALLEEIAATVAQLAEAEGDDLAILRHRLSLAREVLVRSTDSLLTQAQEDMRTALASAATYLDLAGCVIGGWMMARSALVAQERLFAGQDPDGFCDAKLMSARIYAEHELVRAPGLEVVINDGGRCLLNYPDEAF
ncbi:acyl-CoA dehydrogenase [Lacibacterium aquatile]|uniref:Acyl-CoA dehydrogenase n=1 Tax=Lacibacterium aquatile TaxID=1168082 RepID=A0ABW5DN87_9PROT